MFLRRLDAAAAGAGWIVGSTGAMDSVRPMGRANRRTGFLLRPEDRSRMIVRMIARMRDRQTNNIQGLVRLTGCAKIGK